MNPPIRGPLEGPTKGANATKTMGFCNLFLGKMSDTVPPETDRKELPEKPWKKRVTINVAIFCATADGMVHITNMDQDVR
jgi:hypothetical protein